jgi:hypothetical protein
MCNHADIIEVSEQSSTTRGLIEGVRLQVQVRRAGTSDC